MCAKSSLNKCIVRVVIVAQVFRKPLTMRRMRTGYSQAKNYLFTCLLPGQSRTCPWRRQNRVAKGWHEKFGDNNLHKAVTCACFWETLIQNYSLRISKDSSWHQFVRWLCFVITIFFSYQRLSFSTWNIPRSSVSDDLLPKKKLSFWQSCALPLATVFSSLKSKFKWFCFWNLYLFI